MSLPDRMAVAKEIGLEGAEKLVEKMADRSGISPSVVLSAIHKAEKSGATTPAALLRELVGGAAEELVADVEVPAEPAFETSFEPLPEEVPGQTAAGRDETPAVVEAEISDPSPMAPEQATTAEPVVAPEQIAETVPAEKPEPVAVSETPLPAEPVVKPEPEPEPERAVSPAAAKEIPAAPGDSSLLDDLRQEDFLLKRLQLLDRLVEETRRLGCEQLLQLLALFPSGWPRRRAFETLVRSGVPAQLEDALALVEQLQRPSERLWALTSLAAARMLTAEDRERLVNATRQQALQRRLRIRLGVGLTQ
jgi:hypothetical protein